MPQSIANVPLNTTTARGLAKMVIGAAVMLQVIPAEMQQQLVEHATAAIGAITTLWGVVAFMRGLGRAKGTEK